LNNNMDYRLINTLETNEGWRTLKYYLHERLKELEQEMITFHSFDLAKEKGRLDLMEAKGRYREIKELIEIVRNPARVSGFFTDIAD